MRSRKPPAPAAPEESVRISVFLARAGWASRRKAEVWVEKGHVTVNDKPVRNLATKVTTADVVRVDGKRLHWEEQIYWLLYKPKGVMTTLSDPEGRPTVSDLLPRTRARIFPVGRLDMNTEGVLLLTNDGPLASALMHPRSVVKKTYEVKVRGRLQDFHLERLQKGLTIEVPVGNARPGRVAQILRDAPVAKTRRVKVAADHIDLLRSSEGGNNSWFQITLHEGRNRQIHRMMEVIGFQVAKIKRIRYAGLELGTLQPGQFRPLKPRELKQLQALRPEGASPKAPAPRRR